MPHLFSKQKPFRKVIVGIILGGVLLGGLWFALAARRGQSRASALAEKRETKPIPPLDEAAPTELETATFALG